MVSYLQQKEGPHRGAGLGEAPTPVVSGGLRNRRDQKNAARARALAAFATFSTAASAVCCGGADFGCGRGGPPGFVGLCAEPP